MRFAMLLVVTLVALCACVAIADAQPAVPLPALSNPNGPVLAGWCALGYAVMGTVVSALRPDNTALPFTVSTGARVAILAAGGVVMAFLLEVVNGTYWLTALGTAAVSAIAAFGAHGAPHLAVSPDAPAVKSMRPAPAPAARGFARVGALVLIVAVGFGCAALVKSAPADTALGLCALAFVEQHPGLTLLEYVAQAAVACDANELDVLEDLASADPAPAAAKTLQAQARALKSSGGAKLQAFAAEAHARAIALRNERGGK